MTLHSQAKLLLRYQSLGIICIVMFIIAGVFSYFLFKDNVNYQHKLETLDQEIRLQQESLIKLEAKGTSEYILYMNSRAEQQLMAQAKTAVEQAHSIASSIYAQQKDTIPQAQLKQLISASLRDIRFFNSRGYYFIVRFDSLSILLPTAPELEGKLLLDSPKSADPIKRILSSVANPQGEGYSRYHWYQPNNPNQLSKKVSFAKVFEPFNWVIGAGDYISSFEDDLRQVALERLSSLKSESKANITVIDSRAQIISHSKALINPLQNIYNLEPDIYQKILDFAHSGGGFINYSKLVSTQESIKGNERLAYIKTIHPFGWVLISDIPPNKINDIISLQREQVEAQSRTDLLTLFAVLAITAVLTLTILYLYTFWFKRLFRNYQNSLDLQQDEIKLNTQELNLASKVFESVNDAIIVTDANYLIIAANPASFAITGYSSKELIGKDPLFLAVDLQDRFFYQQVAELLIKEGCWQGELYHKRKNGERYPVRISISTSLDQEQQVLNYISVFSDISEHKETEQRLIYLADFDPLTKLAKRHVIAEQANQVISDSKNSNQKFSLMLIDLDRFKNINDTLGHNIGDQVLQQVAQRLSANIRASDTISRLSGDEFIILVNHNKAKSAATRLANRVLRDLAEPIKIGTHDLVVTPSIGIATYPYNGENFDALLKNADAALHHAKAQGRNNYQFFTIDMHQRASEKLTLERGLRQALHKNQFNIHYQAQYDLNTDQLIGCEALLRWHCPELDNPSPDKFIPVAEDTGLILPIGQWVIDQACLQAARWISQGFEPVPVAVNVSSYQFNKNIVASIKRSLKNAELDPKWLVVEITESALMQDPEFTKQLLLQLQQLGIEIALDDFGTGYSSLAYLKRFPIDKLKIDKTFISGLPQDQDDLVITRSIIDVACNLNMTIIAEGVETIEQQQLLKSLGCHQMQGYLKARPVDAQQFSSEHLSLRPLKTSDTQAATAAVIA